MKKLIKFSCMAFALLAMTLTSCSDKDENEPEIKPDDSSFVDNVFSEGLPLSVNGGTPTVNEKGQVTKISFPSEGEDVIFEYGDFSRAVKFNLRMYIVDAKTGRKGDMFYVELNKNGFASYVEGVDPEDGSVWCKYQFSYNKAGQLENIKEIDGDYVEEYRLTYTDGNITKIEWVDEDDVDTYNYLYTNSRYKTPVPNKCCIMFFSQGDMFEPIDLDDFEWAYYAGLLGKATKNLPMARVSYGETDEFDWEFNAKQMPLEFWPYLNDGQPIVFRW